MFYSISFKILVRSSLIPLPSFFPYIHTNGLTILFTGCKRYCAGCSDCHLNLDKGIDLNQV